jgi:hypothetical protein
MVPNMKQRGRLQEHIIRVLLVEPDGTLSKYKLAKKAESSFPWTHELLNKLEALKLVKGTKVTDYAGLLNYWLQIKTKPEKKDYMHKDPTKLIQKTELPYALTTYQAENLVQHYLFPSRTDLYVKAEDAAKWHNKLTVEGLVGKGNLRLLIADAHVFYGAFKTARANSGEYSTANRRLTGRRRNMHRSSRKTHPKGRTTCYTNQLKQKPHKNNCKQSSSNSKAKPAS